MFELDQSKSRLVMLRAGYRYMPSTNGATEHRGLLEATASYPLVRGVLLSDRNRVDFRFIDGEFAWRYRNRIIGRTDRFPYVPITLPPTSARKSTMTAT